MQNIADPVAQRLKILQIIVFTMAATILFYIFMGAQAIERNQGVAEMTGSLQNQMTPIFGFVALSLIIMAVVVPDFILKSALTAKSTTGTASVSTMNPTAGGPSANPTAVPSDSFQSFFMSNIIRFAMFESVAILGFVIAFTSTDMNFSYILSGAALAGFAIFFPTKEKVDKFLKTKQRAH